MNKALEIVRAMINGANEYEKKTGDKNPPVYFSKDNLLIIEEALHRLESIDNANPSEALKCLEEIKSQSPVCHYDDGSKSYVFEKEFDTIKQALLKAQEPKHYLKWEDLEFNGNNEYSYFKVKLGDNVYKAFSYFSYVFNKDTVVIKTYNQIAITEDNKQFFNDLHLERVEE